MILLQANVNSKSFSMLVLVEAVDIHLQQKLYQLRVLPIDILSVQWLAQSIAKVFIPNLLSKQGTCF